MSKDTFKKFYSEAKRPEDLPWHREEIPRLLEKAMVRTKPGRALDIGCGTGVFSSALAQKGFDVTGLDFTAEALRMAEQRAASLNVKVRFVQADVLAWDDFNNYDLILDSGCLHSLDPKDRRQYKRQILRWLTPDGNYLLGHFGRRHVLDWRPIGPRRRTRGQITTEFAPELIELEHHQELFKTPFPIGPIVQFCEYWFRRS